MRTIKNYNSTTPYVKKLQKEDFPEISYRETLMIEYLIQGYKIVEIAELLNVHERTVQEAIKRIRAKAECKTTTQLAIKYLVQFWI